MLADAGANILMQVPVGDVMGTAIDFAYFSFQLDVRFAHTPLHALNMQERDLLKKWRQLLALMANLLRKSAALMQRKSLDMEQFLQMTAPEDQTPIKRFAPGKSPPKPVKYTHYFYIPPLLSAFLTALLKPRDCKSFLRPPSLKFCYYCGRSVFMKLTVCGRCQRVYFCSKSCKMKAWDEIHKEECLQMAAYLDAHQKRFSCKPRKPRTVTIIRYKPEPPKPLTKAEQDMANQIYLKENYSLN
ncbi:hypothetical protein CCH79_00009500 [Gambusia affinis]|uniref:MYND-type domain-containing protein n=1 Tax=Gambusia affinis TaxID=33528 RepID=A0A315VDE2_GAMAF|nr:hypothetical protein CCH79_00009500 [Gambusia affinis]